MEAPGYTRPVSLSYTCKFFVLLGAGFGAFPKTVRLGVQGSQRESKLKLKTLNALPPQRGTRLFLATQHSPASSGLLATMGLIKSLRGLELQLAIMAYDGQQNSVAVVVVSIIADSHMAKGIQVRIQMLVACNGLLLHASCLFFTSKAHARIA